MRLASLRAGLLAAALALSAAAAFGQDPNEPAATPPAPVAPAAPEPPAAVAAAEIVSRSEEAKNLLKLIEASAAPDAAELEVEAKLPELAGKLRERAARADDVIASAASLEAVADLKDEWTARADALANWRHALTRRAIAIEDELAKLDLEEQRWEATRDAALSTSLPEATRARIAETIGAVKAAEKAVKRRRTHVLALQNEVAQEELLVSGILERVDALHSALRSRLFARDEAPLWSPAAYAGASDAAQISDQIRAGVGDKLDEVGEYLRLGGSRLLLQAACFFLVLVGLLLARPRVLRSAQDDPTLAAAARIFARPFSSAIVVSTATNAILARRVPAVVLELEGLVLLVPMLRLLPKELLGGLRAGVFGLALLFAVGSLRSLVSGAPILERFWLLAEALGGIALFLWFRVDHVQHLQQIGRFAWAILPAARVALLILVAAAIANVVGALSVSRLLVRATLSSAYAAIAVYTIARIASGALTALLRSSSARHLRLVRDHGALVRRRILVALQWSAAAAWVWIGLRLFRVDDEVFAASARVVSAKLELGTVSISLGDVLAFLATVWVAFALSRFLRFVLEEDVMPRVSLPRGVPAAISTGVHYAILLLGFVLAIGAAGIDLSRFGLLAGAFGVGIGFGLQNVVNNFVSGLILLFERPVQTGDTIEVGGLSGEVQRIGIRSSTVRTAEGADVIVPNASLISERVVNWTFSEQQRRVDVRVGVAYGNDPEKVIALLVGVGRAHPEMLAIPEPVAHFVGFGESSLDFTLLAWCRFEIHPRVRSELAVAVHAALRDAGVAIPFPQRDVRVELAPGAAEIGRSGGGEPR